MKQLINLNVICAKQRSDKTVGIYDLSESPHKIVIDVYICIRYIWERYLKVLLHFLSKVNQSRVWLILTSPWKLLNRWPPIWIVFTYVLEKVFDEFQRNSFEKILYRFQICKSFWGQCHLKSTFFIPTLFEKYFVL